MVNILKKWVESDKREIKRLNKIANKVESYADQMAKLSDEELKAQTPKFKERYQNGETLDDLLPEAFAVAREGAKRVLGLYPYHVQILGGIVLHEGNIATLRHCSGTSPRCCQTEDLCASSNGGERPADTLLDSRSDQASAFDGNCYVPKHCTLEVAPTNDGFIP